MMALIILVVDSDSKTRPIGYHNKLGNFLKKICHQDISQIAQYGHTDRESFSQLSYAGKHSKDSMRGMNEEAHCYFEMVSSG